VRLIQVGRADVGNVLGLPAVRVFGLTWVRVASAGWGWLRGWRRCRNASAVTFTPAIKQGRKYNGQAGLGGVN